MLALWPLFWLPLVLIQPLCSLELDFPGTWPDETSILDQNTAFSMEMDGCTCIGAAEQGLSCSGSTTCTRFPTRVHSTTQQLKVVNTFINTLHVFDIGSLGNLQNLNFEENPYLEQIEPGAFNGLVSLLTLSIKQSPLLKILKKGAFKGLHNLVELILENNGFASIEDISYAIAPIFLPQLEKLSLKQNNFVFIDAHNFEPLHGTRLQDLTLIQCQLEYIHPEALKPLQHLRALYLGLNPLNEITLINLFTQLIKDNTKLDYLSLHSIGFSLQPPKDLLKIIGQTNITHLVLSKNNFPRLIAGSFPKMPQIQILQIEASNIISIEKDTLNETVLPNLRSLYLAHNMLTHIPPGVQLPNLVDLDLSTNTWKDFSSSYFDIGVNNFIKMSSLSNLSLAYNKIDILRSGAFNGLVNLSLMLHLTNASIQNIQPGAFQDLGKLTFLGLNKNYFSSSTGLTANVFEGLDSLEVLLLGSSGITNLSDPGVFSHLPLLDHLSLEDNQIVTLNPDIFAPLTNLVGLDLSNNFLEPWIEKRLFQNNPNLSVLLMSANKIQYLSPVMLEDFSTLTRLKIDQNAFLCDCAYFYSAQQWLKTNNFTLDNILDLKTPVVCYSPESWKNKNVTEFMKSLNGNTSCDLSLLSRGDSGNIYISLAVSLAVLLLLGVIFGVVGYKYRYYFHYWIFLARMDLRRNGIMRFREKKNFCKGYVNYQYDAFVSYSSEDRNFVVRLVAMLENYEPFLKLCVYERDFQIGRVISEAVLESVAVSRRTLLIVSDAFARSQWCLWELQIAEHHRLFFEEHTDDPSRRDDPLVMVKLGDVASSHMTPTLKYLLRTRIYLQWDSEPKKQRIFWERLRATLAPPNIAIKTTTQ